MKPLRVLLSGGGTGGHIFPAISIANEIRKKHPETDFLFVGAEGKMEMEKVPAAGYKIIGLPVVGLQRKFTFSNLLLPFKLFASLRKAKKIIQEFHPDIVIGTGGYASGPALYAACQLKIPTLIQEQNSFAGITNKWLSKKVNRICVAYSGMEKFFPADKIILTGNPIRQDIQKIENKKQEALNHFQLNSTKKTLLVIGGSLGARTINLAIGNGLEQLAKNEIQLIWQTGKNFIETAREKCNAYEQANIHAFDFISRMDLAYAAADVVISRAGASSVSELCVAEKACILVPSPNVAEDHQTKNAKALTAVNAALLITDSDASNLLLNSAIALLNNSSKQEELKKNIAKLSMPNSAEKITEEIYKLLSEKS
jgi:UDP-N-acetylglucosamine--N-acetylmuramyl-(pentapeptide) pyrophosphoryl-undecaprenol N-acetylglucosamine transferase